MKRSSINTAISDSLKVNRFLATPVKQESQASKASFILLWVLFLGLSSCTQDKEVSPESAATHSTSREATTILYEDPFESNKYASFWYPELHGGEGIMTREQIRSGQQAMRFSFQKDKYDGNNQSAHTELATAPLPEGEDERWYGYSVYMPSAAMANDPEPLIFSQWHGFPDDGVSHTVPPLCFTLKGDNDVELAYTASSKPITKVMQTPTSSKVMIVGKAQYDQWVDYVVHVKWDPTGKEGVLQVWINGVLKVDEHNIAIGYPEKRKPYWKIGVYCWSGKSKYDERVLYYDETRVGDATSSYEAVRPGNGVVQ